MHIERPPSLIRRAVLALALLAVAPILAAEPAAAAPDPAAAFVNDNIQKGLRILNDKQLSQTQKRDQFEHFLLGLVDVRRIAVFTLGPYRRTASPADVDAFVAAFRDYAVAAYQSYFSKYSNQTLKVTGSTQRAPTDYIVTTNMIDPGDSSGRPPLEVDFRVRTDTGKPVLVDVAVAGVWLSLEQRDQFTAFLGQNNGNVRALIAHLSDLAQNLGKPTQ
ncbi:MAG TPA: ABC transporter substrate-binding protein [Rhizomicrobium sp.]|jgi:phospholipid transport system substrate-binding protein|nr:ABC transporter substrate-binding protein [Rhizomicrobium sp.]